MRWKRLNRQAFFFRSSWMVFQQDTGACVSFSRDAIYLSLFCFVSSPARRRRAVRIISHTLHVSKEFWDYALSWQWVYKQNWKEKETISPTPPPPPYLEKNTYLVRFSQSLPLIKKGITRKRITKSMTLINENFGWNVKKDAREQMKCFRFWQRQKAWEYEALSRDWIWNHEITTYVKK